MVSSAELPKDMKNWCRKQQLIVQLTSGEVSKVPLHVYNAFDKLPVCIDRSLPTLRVSVYHKFHEADESSKSSKVWERVM